MSALVDTARTPPTTAPPWRPGTGVWSPTPRSRLDERRLPTGPVRPDPAGAEPCRSAAEPSPTRRPANLRIDFGAHFESNYQRLVAQLYAITLDAGQAHDAVQDAYARAWRRWSTVGRAADPSAWVRSVAVRSTIRSWRSVLARFGIGGPAPDRQEHRTPHPGHALRAAPAAGPRSGGPWC